MNTSEVARLIGVSASTIQRWVKQLGLPMEKNERGHYLFNSDDIDLLKMIKEQIQNGVLLHDITPLQEKRIRKGVNKTIENDKGLEKLLIKVSELETRLNNKADSVASYQLLQHRQEIEELQNQVKILMERISLLENQVKPISVIDKPLVIDQLSLPKKTKRKNIVSLFFGF